MAFVPMQSALPIVNVSIIDELPDHVITDSDICHGTHKGWSTEELHRGLEDGSPYTLQPAHVQHTVIQSIA
jgi:hypothetical protein